MPLSKRLTFGCAGTVCALALAVASEPSTAQSRFDGQNDVPGAVLVDPDEQKINPDTIPEFPSTGDTSIRPRFYMSPGSRCTKLEDPLPGGCEANTLQKDSRVLPPVEGRILPFPLTLPPLPPVALGPISALDFEPDLAFFYRERMLPELMASPPIVLTSPSVPGAHLVYLPDLASASARPFLSPRLPRPGGPPARPKPHLLMLAGLSFILDSPVRAMPAGVPDVLPSSRIRTEPLIANHARLWTLRFLARGKPVSHQPDNAPPRSALPQFQGERVGRYVIAQPVGLPTVFDRFEDRNADRLGARPSYKALMPGGTGKAGYGSNGHGASARVQVVRPQSVVTSLERNASVMTGSALTAQPRAVIGNFTSFVRGSN
ncbi:hypothetical protein [Dichotomicrobium thermohalophilum]|uniref:Uncharacterized protein n=1 Tax=Dichotomicrobium thermohalophilum TaxID=933063 RepID=A0A397Q7H8_9HYPH|nr:hypothetical protein [Dichotomicrobium thermohalophilum]RIA55765.1 hypothetical protein BXY53_0841 [Dichotomicrobium thermohalophilum]